MNALTKRTRPRGFAPWNPRPDTLAVVNQVKEVLAEYVAFLPLTCRQIWYRIVGTKGFPKTERDYSRLCEVVGRARRAGLIPFAHIRDDGGQRIEETCFEDAADFIANMVRWAEDFRLDRQDGQSRRLWVMCEAAGMAPMLAGVANAFGVPVLTKGGFDSTTTKQSLARELVPYLAAGTYVEILHIGDRDPSGEHLFSSLAEDVTQMVVDISGSSDGLTFTRLAVTPEQVESLGLATAPPKPTDNRQFDGLTTQVEAIPPDVLCDILRKAIEARRNPWAENDVLDREREIRAELLAQLGGIE